MAEKKRFSIAMDGPAGAGKSTIAKLVARKYDLEYVDTGAMYRSVALLSHRDSVDISDHEKLIKIAESSKFHFRMDEKLVNHLTLNGEDVTTQIREPHISQLTSKVAAVGKVREILVEEQRRMAQTSGVVMEGRDICTVVLPNAQVKIFLTASPEERARRRHLELQAAGKNDTLEEVLKEVKERDERDMNREVAPLKPAADSVTLSTDGLSIDEVVAKICEVTDQKV
eukprot:CAMPEP_0201489188 /NCGR_PEP_ID=MMETSP0151_2-20130828/21124_1 /ASSEMBLY_ACC=CAM_ASM_000257 /TAXON_ID=200890 /ORGANISM="Paramoeba atlantica, Strain 621/1 / CCAP 1560/9" /LENGTH=226 /DNA_ID=CAMNT_0047874687 /DNA_START=63 /DNA_END=743 /DNA_ORIENTATION=-